MKMYFGDGDGEIDADGESSDAGEEADQHEQAAKEFGEGREVGGPAGQSEAGDELYVVVKSAEDLVISVDDHDGAQGETHDEKRQGLQTIEVAHVVSSGEETIDYSSGLAEGSGLRSVRFILQPKFWKYPSILVSA